jgi:hypothetical protein
MKKIMSLMLGLSLLAGSAAVFAQDKPADSKKSAKKKKGSKKKKTADTTKK